MNQLLTSKAQFLDQCRGNRRAFLLTLFDIDSALKRRFCGVYVTLWILFEIASYAYDSMFNRFTAKFCNCCVKITDLWNFVACHDVWHEVRALWVQFFL